MMDDLDRQAIHAAQQYHRAGEIPRDEIWERLERSRSRDIRARSRRRTIAAAALVVAGAAAGLGTEALLRHDGAGGEPPFRTTPLSHDVSAYLASSDSLIAAFRFAANGGRIRSDFASWARELVAQTQSLEGSVPPADSALRRLFADLDLILIQIAQYASQPGVSRMELRLIEDAIEARRITPSLRAALHAPSGTGS